MSEAEGLILFGFGIIIALALAIVFIKTLSEDSLLDAMVITSATAIVIFIAGAGIYFIIIGISKL